MHSEGETLEHAEMLGGQIIIHSFYVLKLEGERYRDYCFEQSKYSRTSQEILDDSVELAWDYPSFNIIRLLFEYRITMRRKFTGCLQSTKCEHEQQH